MRPLYHANNGGNPNSNGGDGGKWCPQASPSSPFSSPLPHHNHNHAIHSTLTTSSSSSSTSSPNETTSSSRGTGGRSGVYAPLLASFAFLCTLLFVATDLNLLITTFDYHTDHAGDDAADGDGAVGDANGEEQIHNKKKNVVGVSTHHTHSNGGGNTMDSNIPTSSSSAERRGVTGKSHNKYYKNDNADAFIPPACRHSGPSRLDHVRLPTCRMPALNTKRPTALEVWEREREAKRKRDGERSEREREVPGNNGDAPPAHLFSLPLGLTFFRPPLYPPPPPSSNSNSDSDHNNRRYRSSFLPPPLTFNGSMTAESFYVPYDAAEWDAYCAAAIAFGSDAGPVVGGSRGNGAKDQAEDRHTHQQQQQRKHPLVAMSGAFEALLGGIAQQEEEEEEAEAMEMHRRRRSAAQRRGVATKGGGKTGDDGTTHHHRHRHHYANDADNDNIHHIHHDTNNIVQPDRIAFGLMNDRAAWEEEALGGLFVPPLMLVDRYREGQGVRLGIGGATMRKGRRGNRRNEDNEKSDGDGGAGKRSLSNNLSESEEEHSHEREGHDTNAEMERVRRTYFPIVFTLLLRFHTDSRLLGNSTQALETIADIAATIRCFREHLLLWYSREVVDGVLLNDATAQGFMVNSDFHTKAPQLELLLSAYESVRMGDWAVVSPGADVSTNASSSSAPSSPPSPAKISSPSSVSHSSANATAPRLSSSSLHHPHSFLSDDAAKYTSRIHYRRVEVLASNNTAGGGEEGDGSGRSSSWMIGPQVDHILWKRPPPTTATAEGNHSSHGGEDPPLVFAATEASGEPTAVAAQDQQQQQLLLLLRSLPLARNPFHVHHRHRDEKVRPAPSSDEKHSPPPSSPSSPPLLPPLPFVLPQLRALFSSSDEYAECVGEASFGAKWAWGRETEEEEEEGKGNEGTVLVPNASSSSSPSAPPPMPTTASSAPAATTSASSPPPPPLPATGRAYLREYSTNARYHRGALRYLPAWQKRVVHQVMLPIRRFRRAMMTRRRVEWSRTSDGGNRYRSDDYHFDRNPRSEEKGGDGSGSGTPEDHRSATTTGTGGGGGRRGTGNGNGGESSSAADDDGDEGGLRWVDGGKTPVGGRTYVGFWGGASDYVDGLRPLPPLRVGMDVRRSSYRGDHDNTTAEDAGAAGYDAEEGGRNTARGDAAHHHHQQQQQQQQQQRNSSSPSLLTPPSPHHHHRRTLSRQLDHAVAALRRQGAAAFHTRRGYAWAFFGKIKQDRRVMRDTFLNLSAEAVAEEDNAARARRVRGSVDNANNTTSRNGYGLLSSSSSLSLSPLRNFACCWHRDIERHYGRARFVLIGRGHVALDCLRIYEALASGAIPIVVTEKFGELFENFGSSAYYYNDDHRDAADADAPLPTLPSAETAGDLTSSPSVSSSSFSSMMPPLIHRMQQGPFLFGGMSSRGSGGGGGGSAAGGNTREQFPLGFDGFFFPLPPKPNSSSSATTTKINNNSSTSHSSSPSSSIEQQRQQQRAHEQAQEQLAALAFKHRLHQRRLSKVSSSSLPPFLFAQSWAKAAAIVKQLSSSESSSSSSEVASAEGEEGEAGSGKGEGRSGGRGSRLMPSFPSSSSHHRSFSSSSSSSSLLERMRSANVQWFLNHYWFLQEGLLFGGDG